LSAGSPIEARERRAGLVFVFFRDVWAPFAGMRHLLKGGQTILGPSPIAFRGNLHFSGARRRSIAKYQSMSHNAAIITKGAQMAIDAQIVAEIETAEKNFADLFKRGDFPGVGAIFAEDAIMLPPGSEILVGRSNIQSYWGRGRGVQELRFSPTSVKSVGVGAVRETGALQLWTKSPRQRLREVSCKYVFVWQQIANEWKLETCIWNRIVDPTARGNRQGRRAGQGGGGSGAGQGRFQGGGGSGAGQGRFQGGGGPGAVQGRFQGGGGQGRFQGGEGEGQQSGRGPGGGGQGAGQGRFQGGAGQGGRAPGGGRGRRGGVNHSQEPFVPRLDE
jgi:ketosteroid isomerase-like protein